jgi:hypothetical protein
VTFRSGRLLWLPIAAIIVLTLAADLARTARADMSFLLYAAGRLLDGAELYRDVVEINPPLIVWLNVPIVALARAAGVSELRLYPLAVTALMAALLGYCARIARRYALTEEPELRRWFLLALALALFPLAREDYGQREHLVLGLLLPYLLLVVARRRSVPVPSAEAAAIGCLAAIGFALKPHFVLVWIALEGMRRWRRSVSSTISPETAAVAVVIAVYVAVVYLATPAYFNVVALLGPVYARYLPAPVLELLVLSPGAALVLLAALALIALRRRLPDPAVTATLAVGMLACLLAAAAQQKGLRYHFYPAFALAFVLVAVLARLPLPTENAIERLYSAAARAAAIAVGVVALGGTAITAGGGSAQERAKRAELNELVQLVKAKAGGRPLAVLSYHMESAFPLVSYAGVPLATRFHHLWIIPASYWDSLTSPAPLRFHSMQEMSAAERWLNQAVRDDLLAARPDLLIVLRPARDTVPNGPRRVHYVRYFSRQPDLADFFTHYRLARQIGEFDVYERAGGRVNVAERPSLDPARADVRGASGIRIAANDPEFAAGIAIFILVLAVSLRRRNSG